MDQSAIQAKINAGYAKASRFLGAPFTQYRPTNPLAPLSVVVTPCLLAKFDIDPGFAHKAPSKYGNPLYYLLADATDVIPGDYLVGTQGTWFVAGMEPNVPPLCVQCNKVISAGEPDHLPAPGSDYYNGYTGMTTTLAGWPASILQGTKGEKGDSQLPGDVRLPWVQILLPRFPNILIHTGDPLSTDVGENYIVSSAEETDLGWRITAMLAQT